LRRVERGVNHLATPTRVRGLILVRCGTGCGNGSVGDRDLLPVSRTAWVWGLGVAVLMLLPGLFTRRYFNLGISAWNHGTRVLFRVLRNVALRLCFYITFPLLQRSGTAMDLVPPGVSEGANNQTNWHIHTSAAKRAMRDAVRGEAWLSDLIRHARATGNWWLLSLVPLVFTLILMGEEVQDSAPPTSTYTLY
jgi:hypothetical protein